MPYSTTHSKLIDSNVLVIGVHGPAGSGKDDFGSFIEEYFQSKGRDVKSASLADPIKNICAYIFGGTPDTYYTQEGKADVLDTTYGLTIRSIMQKVGTDSFRKHISDQIWIDVFQRQVLDKAPSLSVVIIPDIRQDNEFELVKANGGIVIGICPLFPDYKQIAQSNHETEQSRYLLCDAVIANDTSIEAFKEKALAIANIIDTVYFPEIEANA